MKKTLLISLLVSLIMVFPSCETDFEVNADWEEITIIYGLLNQEDTAHYFRINKAFLGGNALEIAKIEDSSSYKNDLEVILEGWEGSTKKQTIVFDTTTISNKDTGTWYNPYMVVYKGVGELNEDYDYKLFVKNTKSGKEMTSETKLIHNFTIEKPNAGGKANFNPDPEALPTKFSWKNGVNAMRYEPLLRFYYFEVPIGTTDTIPKFVDWNQATQTATSAAEVEIFVNGSAFYTVIASKIEPDFSGVRLAGTVDYIVSAAGEEYDTYLNVNEPSTSLVQDRPEYTNINNGFGLMSSRYQVNRIKNLHADTEANLINMNLGFVKSPWVK